MYSKIILYYENICIFPVQQYNRLGTTVLVYMESEGTFETQFFK